MEKKIFKIITISVIFFSFALISSNLTLIIQNDITLKNGIYFSENSKDTEVKVSSGLAPKVVYNNPPTLSSKFGGYMWGYLANSSVYNEGTCLFDVDDPGYIEFLNNTESDDFLSGGTGGAGEWWACENSTGALWKINPYSGDMTYIGGGGVGLNGLSWDFVYNRLYGASGSSLYEINPETGEQEFIGSFGNGINNMIAIASDIEGVTFGWDLDNDALWIIDTETGEATEIGPLEIDINYAQDGCFDYESDTFYLTAYTTTGQLYECDKTTGKCTLIGDFQDGAQITASVMSFGCPPLPRDVGVVNINCPVNGIASENMSMQTIVKNYGYSTETTDVEMNVIKHEIGQLILEEDFSGAFPPDGWTTDWWTQSNSNYACGNAPEAMCYKYTQANNGDYYDNYIMSSSLNCSNIKKVELSFRYNYDIAYSNYCYFHIKYRKDTNSPWNDVTPWGNPIPFEYGCEELIISIYGDPFLGDEFQVKWEYVGYYYYFNYWWLDDVTIREFYCSEEYNEVIEDVEIPYDCNKIINFPDWTPKDWQDSNFKDTCQCYTVQACTLLDDDNPQNNCKQKNIDLYFPFIHDVGVIDFTKPKSGPAQTFPVTGFVSNFGQYIESNFNTFVEIYEIDIDNEVELLSEKFTDSTFPPSGFNNTHNNWMFNLSDNAGGITGEARFFNSPAKTDFFRFFAGPIDSTGCDFIEIEFKNFIDHFSNPYTLQVETSIDAINWDVVWYKNPFGNEGPKTIKILTEENIGSIMYVSWTFIGYSKNINSWYIDDIIINGYSTLKLEYEDYISIEKINSGEVIEMEFDEWTPEFLENETTGTKKYAVKSWTELENPKDENSKNDLYSKCVSLDYFHDVRVKEVTSPQPHCFLPNTDWIHYDDGNNVDAFGCDCSCTFEYAVRFTSQELGFGTNIFVIKRHHSNNTSFYMTGKIKIYKEGTPTSPGDLITEEPFECYDAGWHEIFLSEPVEIYDDEDIWVSCEVTHKAGQYPAGMDPSGPVQGKSDWLYMNSEWKEASEYGIYTDWNLWAGVIDYKRPIAHIKPGIYDINITVDNIGTFPEMNLTCYANIKEYITDPYNGTLVYEDNITDINLEQPLGGTENLEFEDYNFEMEGIYGLNLNIPYEFDDYQRNNNEIIGIYVDNTTPCSSHELYPENPDGENEWYISDVKVRLLSEDPYSNEVSSGVKEIKYKIGNNDWETISGCEGSFMINEDGDDILVQYYAIDNVGNEEPINTFTIDLDQTEPEVTFNYEIKGGNNLMGWKFLFTAIASDNVSRMDRVEFYLNNELQNIITGSGPEYNWTLKYEPLPKAIFTAIAYNRAGLCESDEIIDPKTKSKVLSKCFELFNKNSNNINIPKIR